MNDKIRYLLGQQIVTLRQQVGLSQEQVAGAARMSRRFLSELERGERAASVDTIAKLARALGVPPRRLLDFDEAPPAPWDHLEQLVRALAAQGSDEDIARIARILRAYFGEDKTPRRREAKRRKKDL